MRRAAYRRALADQPLAPSSEATKNKTGTTKALANVLKRSVRLPAPAREQHRMRFTSTAAAAPIQFCVSNGSVAFAAG